MGRDEFWAGVLVALVLVLVLVAFYSLAAFYSIGYDKAWRHASDIFGCPHPTMLSDHSRQCQ